MKQLFTILVLELVFVCNVGAQGRTYTTNFPATENPVSQGGNWVNGRAVGLDWSDARTIPGLAFGTNSFVTGGNYDDSTAVVTGTWAPDQMAQATVHTVNQQPGTSVYEEVELRLRTTIQPHNLTGYEINFRCTLQSQDSNSYVQIGRWNGPVNSFNAVGNSTSVQGPGLRDGDVVKATIIGNTIKAYINDVLINQATDPAPFTTGSPGMGFWLHGLPASSNSDFGFTRFTASEIGAVPTAPAAPTGLRVIR